MPHTLAQQCYGKSHVRVSRISRTDSHHKFTELTVDISLGGDFDVAYTEGNNQSVVPTDTMKNTVYALAKKQGITSCETFAMALASHFVKRFPHVSTTDVTVREKLWDRIRADANEHPHAFVAGGSEQNICMAKATNTGTSLRSGIDGLQVLKTTESAFSDFLRDEYTTLAETDDRIFATTITATWPCEDLVADWTEHRQTIRAALLNVFSSRFSPSVQKTLFEMAEAALEACAAIDEISLKMPNQHYMLADLAPLGLENENEVFVPTSEPFGKISATVRREGSPR